MTNSDPHDFVNVGRQMDPRDCASVSMGSRPLLGWFRLSLRRIRTKNPHQGNRQSPLQTSVQALRDTRLVEEVCAWTMARIPHHPKSFTHG